MKSTAQVCVYCNSSPGVTDDHVPPKSFFPKPRPSNLITVPACAKCNQGAGKDEEYFLATLMFSDAGITKTGKKLWNEKLRRMYEKNIGLRRKVAESMQWRRLSTPAGIYLGSGMTIKYDPSRLETIAMKIIRGLYFYEHGKPIDTNANVLSFFLRERKHFDAVKAYNHMMKTGSIKWKGTFEYRYGFIPGKPTESMWLLWFWETHIFWAITSNVNTQPRITKKNG